jgi:hypothetical protein
MQRDENAKMVRPKVHAGTGMVDRRRLRPDIAGSSANFC